MPREVSSANHLESMNDPLFMVKAGGTSTISKPRTFYHRARNDRRSEGDNLNPNIADRMCTTAALAGGW